MSDLTLLIMAAGMGSRYGGLKQLDGFGPQGQTLLEYSIRDAIQSGFDKIVLVIRPDTQELFEDQLLTRLSGIASVSLVHQAMDALPGDFSIPSARTKPWGTGHAVWVAKNEIKGPFAVINADDFYGVDAFSQLAHFLTECKDDAIFALVGYMLSKTLSAYGTVSRGVCQVDDKGYLNAIQECTNLKRLPNGSVEGINAKGELIVFSGNERVSMNCWAFPVSFFNVLENELKMFITQAAQDLKAEFYLPHVVDTLLSRQEVTVKVLPTEHPWFGVTYPQDKALVVKQLADLG